jgi:replicative DNA helicase
MLLYRDDYYNANAAPGITEVIVAKQRNGPTGTVQMYFDKAQTTFYEIETRTAPPASGEY